MLKTRPICVELTYTEGEDARADLSIGVLLDIAVHSG